MRCPNCGSTAQVRSTGAPILSDNGAVLYEHFTCGCGCYFDVNYERDFKGYWDWSETFIHFVDKEMIKKFEKNT